MKSIAAASNELPRDANIAVPFQSKYATPTTRSLTPKASHVAWLSGTLRLLIMVTMHNVTRAAIPSAVIVLHERGQVLGNADLFIGE